jgi:hypothetical protein
MKHLMLVLGFSLVLAACGENKTTGDLDQDPKSAPTPTSPSPSTTSKWSSQELQTQSQYCSEAGDPTYYDETVWLKFCSCTYKAAALKWTYKEFFANFNTNYTTLYNAGSVPECLRQAGDDPLPFRVEKLSGARPDQPRPRSQFF